MDYYQTYVEVKQSYIQRGGLSYKQWLQHKKLFETDFPDCTLNRDGRNVTLHLVGGHTYFFIISENFPFKEGIVVVSYQRDGGGVVTLNHYLREFYDVHGWSPAIRLSTMMLFIHNLVLANPPPTPEGSPPPAPTPAPGPAPEGSPPLRILVFCHPLDFRHERNVHWDEPIITYITNLYRVKGMDTAIVETVDLNGTPTYQADAFSPEFIREHKEHFDLLFLPDCGGVWAETQFCDIPPQEMWTILKSYLFQIMDMVKQGGRIYFNKFLEKKVLSVIRSDPDVKPAAPLIGEGYYYIEKTTGGNGV